MSGNDWFPTCSGCGKKTGPWTRPKDELCQGHEEYVYVDIDYPDQKAERKDHKGWVKGPRIQL